MAFTNASPSLVPTRAKSVAMGTNPISLATPSDSNDGFVLDMATSTVAFGKVEIKHRQGLDIPIGWGVDSQGKPTTLATDVLQGGGVMPLGGVEETAGYKGTGLAMMVEVFSGILSGSDWGPNIRMWQSVDVAGNLGQCFVAIDPSAFAPGFKDRMAAFENTIRNLEPAEGETSVLIPGDPERARMKACDERGGIDYHPKQMEHLIKVAKDCNVPPMQMLT